MLLVLWCACFVVDGCVLVVLVLRCCLRFAVCVVCYWSIAFWVRDVCCCVVWLSVVLVCVVCCVSGCVV